LSQPPLVVVAGMCLPIRQPRCIICYGVQIDQNLPSCSQVVAGHSVIIQFSSFKFFVGLNWASTKSIHDKSYAKARTGTRARLNVNTR
jgi:hypothetical protein